LHPFSLTLPLSFTVPHHHLILSVPLLYLTSSSLSHQDTCSGRTSCCACQL
jgi:hypothetical protein